MSAYLLAPGLAEFVARTEALTSDADDLAAQRAAYQRMCEVFTPPRPAGVIATDQILAAAGHAVAVRRYVPEGAAPDSGWPCVLYFHGGGWVLGGLDSHEFLTAALAASLQAMVIAVDYRLAPEHPFPAAFEDSYAAWLAVHAGHDELGLDPRRVVVAGDSAGGNLAAALCLALAREGLPGPCGHALLYPALVSPCTQPSYAEHADAPLLRAADMVDFLRLYLPDLTMRNDPRAAPLAAASYVDLPPAFVAVAEFDPLRDEGVAYVEHLQNAGGRAELYWGAGLVHGCLRARGACGAVDDLYAALVAAIARFQAKPV